MSKPVAVFDIDGCVGDYLAMLGQVRREENRPPLSCPSRYNMTDWEQDDRRHAALCFADPDFYRRMWPIRGVIPALHTLKFFYTLVLVTARATVPSLPTSLVGDIQLATIEWLEAWQIPFSSLHFVSGDRRIDFVREEYPDIAFVVEDNPVAAEAYAQAGLFTYIPSYAYNGGITLPNVLYVAGIEKVLADRHWKDELPLIDPSTV